VWIKYYILRKYFNFNWQTYNKWGTLQRMRLVNKTALVGSKYLQKWDFWFVWGTLLEYILQCTTYFDWWKDDSVSLPECNSVSTWLLYLVGQRKIQVQKHSRLWSSLTRGCFYLWIELDLFCSGMEIPLSMYKHAIKSIWIGFWLIQYLN
jgi:hypothetical protein